MQIEYSTNNNQSSGCFGFLIKVITMTCAIVIASYLLPGIHIENPLSAILAAIVISLLNTFLRPILIVVTLPFTIVSLGLFIFIINAGIVYLTSKMIDGFVIDSFWWALLLALIISAVSYLLQLPDKYLNKRKQEKPSQDYPQDYDNEEFTEYEEVTDESDNDQSKEKN